MSRRPASFATASPTPPVPRSAGPDGQPAAAGSSEVRLILVGDRPVRVRHRPAVQGARRARDGARRSGRDDRVRSRPALPRSQAAPGLTGEVTIDRKTRPEGCRVKFRLKANAIKFY